MMMSFGCRRTKAWSSGGVVESPLSCYSITRSDRLENIIEIPHKLIQTF